MYKFFIAAITVLIFLNTASGDSEQSLRSKNILILFSNSPDGPAYRRILDGIMQELKDEFGDSFTSHTEYLQIDQYPSTDYLEKKFGSYKEKYNDINLDLLICVGTNIIDPIKKYADSQILKLPTISADLDFSNFGYNQNLHLNDKTAVLGFKFNIEKNFSTALSLFPETSSIYFISGTSPLDKFLMSVSKDASKTIDQNIKTIFVTDLSMDETLKLVHNLPKNSLIFVPYFTTDSKLVRYHNTEAIRLMSRYASAPIFHFSDLGIGDGSFGGYVMSFVKIGSLIGKTAKKVLKGADPNSIRIIESDYYEYIFDSRELKKWKLLNSDLIPEGSTILFEEINYFDKYKWIVGVILLFIVLQTFLIANLVRLNRSQKIMTKKIIDNEKTYRKFLREDRSLRLGQLTASLTHELNQPLTAILSTAQAGINFINSNEATPDLLKQIFQKIVENDKRGASILSSIRGMMKLETREKEKVNLNTLIEEIAAVFHSEASKLNTVLDVELVDKPSYVLADGIQIQQVLLNFILNASQAMEKVNALNKRITVSSTINNSEVIVSVRDNGHGIDEAIKEKLFRPFITSKEEGMGIGLTISRSIIEDHGGKIWAENGPEGGAIFSFSLKILKDE